MVPFKCISSTVPLVITQQTLPHWVQPGVSYFFTFRLADSVPQTLLNEWIRQRAAWLATLTALFAAGTLVLPDEKTPCAPAGLTMISPREAALTLTEGRYHQVRRMFACVGYEVVALHRTHFGALDLGDLKPGTWRILPLNFFDAPAAPAPTA